MANELKVGDPAPDFNLQSAEGDTYSLSNLKGKTTVLDFYPKDDTPGCTKEACSFLNFPILSDTDSEVSKAYGVYKEKNNYGKKYWGIERTTFVVDGEGQISKVYPKVKVEGHVDEVLEFVKGL